MALRLLFDVTKDVENNARRVIKNQMKEAAKRQIIGVNMAAVYNRTTCDWCGVLMWNMSHELDKCEACRVRHLTTEKELPVPFNLASN